MNRSDLTPAGEVDDADDSALQVFPVAIGSYDEHKQLDVEAEVDRVVELLAGFGGRKVPWPTTMEDRGADAVDRRLRSWARPAEPVASVLYWVGHGWSDGFDVALAHARSPAAVRTSGYLPAQLAEPVRGRQATAGRHWVMVVIDACWSSRFVDKLNAELAAGALGADRVLLVGVSGDGSTSLGRFSAALRLCVEENFRADRRIELWRLAAELDRRLPTGLVIGRRLADAALVRSATPLAATISMPLDVLRELEDVLSRLPADERRHFLLKAQGAEEGEISWFFEGRTEERAQIVRWLCTATAGLLVVTGRAGSGKSALLGHVLVHSLPDLRSVLARSGLVDPLLEDRRPPDSVFDAVVHLTGMTLDVLVRRIADAAGFGALPSTDGAAGDMDWLVERLYERSRPFTLLADALDEANDALVIARTVLRRIAVIPGVRVVVGTRASTSESPDHPEPGDENLLDALAAFSPTGVARLVWITRDPEAVERYVTRRLTIARDRGHLSVDDHPVSDEQIAAAAGAVRRQQREFLFARLAVHELLADPTLLNPGRMSRLDQLLVGDHRDLFAVAVARLTRRSAAFPPLLEALALGRGRGTPILGGIWALMANALAADSEVERAITDTDISALLAAAQPYVAVDMEAGQTVYRLAHRTFTEHFLFGSGAGPTSTGSAGADGPADRQRRISRALIEVTARRDVSNPYVVRHLSGHVSDAADWPTLAAAPAALDRLDPLAVTADALRTVIGSDELSPAIAGVIGARLRLAQAAATDRTGMRQLATAAYSSKGVYDEPATVAAPWVVDAANVERVALHVTLTGHNGYANSLMSFADTNGRRLVASGGDDGTIRLWDPSSAAPVGAPLVGHTGSVSAVCAVPGPAGRTLLASGGDDGTVRLWDPSSAAPVGAPLVGHAGGVLAVCAVPGPGGRTLLASSGLDGTVRLWDTATATPVGAPLVGHTGAVLTACAVPGAAGRTLLASGGLDGTVRLWDTATATPVGAPLMGHTGAVSAVCAVPGPAGCTLLASSGDDRTVRLWDPLTGTAADEPLTGHTGGVEDLIVVPNLGGRHLLASVGADGTIRLWDTVVCAPVGVPLSSMAGALWAACAVPVGDGRTLLASAGEDGAVRLWDLSAAISTGAPLALTPGLVVAVCAVPGPAARTMLVSVTADGTVCSWDPSTATPTAITRTIRPGLVVMVRPVVDAAGRVMLGSAEHDGTVRLWDPLTLAPCGEPMGGHTGPVLALCAVDGPDGRQVLASGGADGTVRLWNPTTRAVAGAAMTGHTSAIRALCAMDGPDGWQLLASGDMDGTIRLWDPARGTAAGTPMGGHPGPVLALCAVRGSDGRQLLAAGGAGGSVRLWDPAARTPVGAAMTGHTSVIRALCAVEGPDGRQLLASGGADRTVRLWDPVTGTASGPPMTDHAGTVRDLCTASASSGPHLLASSGHDGTVRLWNLAGAGPVGVPMGGQPRSVDAIVGVADSAGRPLHVITGESGVLRIWDPSGSGIRSVGDERVVTAVAALPRRGGDLVVTGAADGAVSVVDATTGVMLGGLVRTGVGPVVALCELPVAHAGVAVGCANGTVTAWDLPGGVRTRDPLPAHDGPVRSLRVVAVAGTEILATAGQDGTVRLYDIVAWSAVSRPMTGHTGWVWSLDSVGLADRALLASAGADATVRLWDARTATALGDPLIAHADQVRAVCFLTTPEGRTALASGGHDRTIRIWNPRTRELLHTIPMEMPVHALSQQFGSTDRTKAGTGVVLTVGTSKGIVNLTLHESLLSPP